MLAYKLLFTAAFGMLAFGQEECPDLPDTGVTIGEPVPVHPEDIPAGCSDYEILVGTVNQSPKLWSYAHYY